MIIADKFAIKHSISYKILSIVV